MKLVYIIVVLILVSCIDCQSSDIRTTYIYHVYNKRSIKSKTCNHNYYYKKTTENQEDSIIVHSIYYNRKFKIMERRKDIFFKDSFNLYKVNLYGETKPYFTIKNHNNIFFEGKSINDEGPKDIFLAYNHRYIETTKLFSAKNDSIEVYKFRVGRSWIEDTRDNINEFLDNEYYYYYTKDFSLYKIEYLGRAAYDSWDWEEERLGTIEEVFGK